MISFVTQKNLVPRAVAILIKHGCVVSCADDMCSKIVFPDGTVKEEFWPRVSGDVYELTLPDGYKCAAQYVKYLSQYLIFYQPDNEWPSNY